LPHTNGIIRGLVDTLLTGSLRVQLHQPGLRVLQIVQKITVLIS